VLIDNSMRNWRNVLRSASATLAAASVVSCAGVAGAADVDNGTRSLIGRVLLFQKRAPFHVGTLRQLACSTANSVDPAAKNSAGLHERAQAHRIDVPGGVGRGKQSGSLGMVAPEACAHVLLS
jgi:hypothetical protein